ncbi:MAG: alanine racemase [Clostridia bacterium]
MKESRIKAVINLSNIKHNFTEIKKSAAGSRVISVVKADAYGHGAIEISHAIESSGGDFFAVACVDEAIILREGGIKSDIIILGVTPPAQAELLAKNNLIQSVVGEEYAEKLALSAMNLRIHIKIDTGMSRLGIYCHDFSDIENTITEILKIQSHKNLNCEGVFTHFACSDDTKSKMTNLQFEIFDALCQKCKARGINLGLRHCCNSAAIINHPEMKLDAVRAGLILYGLSPFSDISLTQFLPCMELQTHIAQISHIKKGDTVSYGASFTASRDMKIATLSIGYADGLSRALSEKVNVLIAGKKAMLIGKICMDLCIADVSDIDCAVGDIATVFGNAQSVDTIAKILGTINYEIICSVKNRVPREYIF